MKEIKNLSGERVYKYWNKNYAIGIQENMSKLA